MPQGNFLEIEFSLILHRFREDFKKSMRLSFGHCPKGGVQQESKSFEVVLFSLSLTFFWSLNGGVGLGQSFPCFSNLLPGFGEKRSHKVWF